MPYIRFGFEMNKTEAMSKAITLQEFIMDTQAEFPFVSGQLTRLLTDIGVAAKIVNHQVNRAGLAGILGESGSQNTHNESQQKLDVFADRTFMRILTAGKSVAGIGSEEQENYILCGDQGRSGKYVVMIDPLDGSSNIDVNVSIGTIFSIYRRVTPLGEPLIGSRLPTSWNRASCSGLHFIRFVDHAGVHHRKRRQRFYTRSCRW